MKKILIILFALVALSPMAKAQVFEQAFEEGNKLYAEANFKAATAQYLKVVDAGYASSKLFYNLGNAYYKQKMYAKAVLYYEKAYQLAPSNGQIRHNLELTRLQIRDKIESVPTFFVKEWILSVRNLLSANGWAWLSLLCVALIGTFFMLYRFTGSILMKKLNFTLSSLGVLVFIFSVWNASAQTEKIKHPNAAIIMAPSVVVKSSPDQSGKDLFVLHDGAKITFTETPPVPGWREIRIADGNTGWVESNSYEII